MHVTLISSSFFFTEENFGGDDSTSSYSLISIAIYSVARLVPPKFNPCCVVMHEPLVRVRACAWCTCTNAATAITS